MAMHRRKLISTLVVLFFVQSEYQIEARGYNSGKDSTNLKDLKEIEGRMKTGLDNIKKAGAQIEKMKTEQKIFEKDLSAMLKKNPHAPADMRKLLDDQKVMQAEVSKSQKDMKEYELKFGKWIKDAKGFQRKPNDIVTYEALKPFIRELNSMADMLKITTQKFVEQAKRYKDFGQSMLDSGIMDVIVTKRLCSLGQIIEDMGYKVSDIGDPIALTSERLGDIWQRTYAKDKDTTLPETNKKLTPKGQQVVTDGDRQATSGTELKKMCKRVEEKGKLAKDKKKQEAKKPDKIDCMQEKDAIVKILGNLGKEHHDNAPKLGKHLDALEKLEVEFERLTTDISDWGKIPKDLEEMAGEVWVVKSDLGDVKDEMNVMSICDGETVELFGNKIVRLFIKLLNLGNRFADVSSKLLGNGMDLVERQKYTMELYRKYYVIGDRVEHAGNLVFGALVPTIESMEVHFIRIGVFLGGEWKKRLGIITAKIKGVVGPLHSHGEKIRWYGTEIKMLRPEGGETDDGSWKTMHFDLHERGEPKKNHHKSHKYPGWGRRLKIQKGKDSMVKGRRMKSQKYDMTKDWTEESVEVEQTHKKTHGVKLYFPVEIWKDSEDKMKLMVNGPREGKKMNEWMGDN